MRWDPQAYGQHAGFVPRYGADLLTWMPCRAGQRVLDLGCGDGRLTLRLQAAGARVIGVDASLPQAAAATARGLDVAAMDGTAPGFAAASFDGIFSNAALHWMRPPQAVVAGLARILRPGGWLVAELGGVGNVAVLRRAIHAALADRGVDPAPRDPWYFPTPEAYGRLLADHGFTVDVYDHFPRSTPLPTGIDGWLALFAAPFLAGLDGPTRQAVVEDVIRRAAPQLRQADGSWQADYVRLRLAATYNPPR